MTSEIKGQNVSLKRFHRPVDAGSNLTGDSEVQDSCPASENLEHKETE